MSKRPKPKGHGYSLLFKDSVIYGSGRALQKLLVALLLPLYTAFLSPSDYGILGMVVTVTTFLDVFVTLGFDVAFSRFYFDDKSPEARSRVITNTFYVSTAYPAVLLGVLAALMPSIAPLIMGDQYGAGDWVYFDVGVAHPVLQQPQRSPVHPLPPRAPAVALQRLHHRSGLRHGSVVDPLRGRLRVGADGRVARQSRPPPPACSSRCCRPISARSTGAGTGTLEANARLRRPGALCRRLVLLAEALGSLLPAPLPGEGRGGPLHCRELAGAAALPAAHGVPHGLATVALCQAPRAREAQADGVAQLNVLHGPQRRGAGAARRVPAHYCPHVSQRAVLDDRAGHIRPGRLGRRLLALLRLLGRRQRRQEEPPDPGLLCDRLWREHRPQLLAGAALRDVGGGMDDGGRATPSSPSRSTSTRGTGTRSATSGGDCSRCSWPQS